MAVKAMGFLAVKETVTSSLRLEMPTRWPSGKCSCSGARAVSTGSRCWICRLS